MGRAWPQTDSDVQRSETPSVQVRPAVRREIRIVPALTTVPNMVGISEVRPVLISITNESASGNQQLQTGDAFRLDFDLGDGRIDSFARTVTVTSKALSPFDFVVAQGLGPSQIVLLYQGPPSIFGSQETLEFN